MLFSPPARAREGGCRSRLRAYHARGVRDGLSPCEAAFYELPFHTRTTDMRTRAVLAGLCFIGGVLGLTGWALSRAEEKPKAAALGSKVANSSSLRDVRGNRRPLHDFKGNKA